MALVAPSPFSPLLLPPPPEPPPSLVFFTNLPVMCSFSVSPDHPVPPDPPDPSPPMCCFFSSTAPATLSVCSADLAGLVMFSSETLYYFSTAVCRFRSGWYPAPSNFSMFNFGTTNNLTHGSHICGYLLVVLSIKSEMLFGWVCEALFSAFDYITGFLVVQSFIAHLRCCLTSSLSYNENEVLVVLDLDSHVSIFMVFGNKSLALVRYFTAVCKAQSVYVPTMVVLVLLSNQWMKGGKKSDIICLLTFHRICLVCYRLTYFFMEFIYLLISSLGLSCSGVWSFVLMGASCFSGSFKNLYRKAELQVFSSCLYYDFPAVVAECLALLDAQVAAMLLSIFKLVCKSDYQELICLFSESWSYDVFGSY